MGCNQSKSKDIENSKRSRADGAVPAVYSLQQPIAMSQTTHIPAPGEHDEFRGPESYTDKQMRETDMLKAVIHRTSRLFIDIGQMPVEATSPEQPSHIPIPTQLGDGSQDVLLTGPLPVDPSTSIELLGQPTLNDPEAMNEIFSYLTGERYISRLVDAGEIVVHQKTAGATSQ